MEIKTKQEMYDLQQKGLLGNYLRVWNACGPVGPPYPEWYTLRSKVPDWTGFIPVLHRRNLAEEVLRAMNNGSRWEDLIVGEIPDPTSERIMNCQVIRTTEYIEVFFDMFTTRSLRASMKMARTPLRGVWGQMVLNTWVPAPGLEEIEMIWDRYPEATIEFTVWSKPCGAFKHQTTIWEVRNY